MAANGRQTALAVVEEKNIPRGEGALIVALACGDTAREAAQKAGVGERTVYRRLTDQEFLVKVNKARNLMIGQAVGRLSLTCAKAAETLESCSTVTTRASVCRRQRRFWITPSSCQTIGPSRCAWAILKP
jgi:hypothetical protein